MAEYRLTDGAVNELHKEGAQKGAGNRGCCKGFPQCEIAQHQHSRIENQHKQVHICAPQIIRHQRQTHGTAGDQSHGLQKQLHRQCIQKITHKYRYKVQ